MILLLPHRLTVSTFLEPKILHLSHGFGDHFFSFFWFDHTKWRRKSASTHMGYIMVIGKRICEHGKLEAWSFNGDIHGRMNKEEDDPKPSMMAVQGGQNRTHTRRKMGFVLPSIKPINVSCVSALLLWCIHAFFLLDLLILGP